MTPAKPASIVPPTPRGEGDHLRADAISTWAQNLAGVGMSRIMVEMVVEQAEASGFLRFDWPEERSAEVLRDADQV